MPYAAIHGKLAAALDLGAELTPATYSERVAQACAVSADDYALGRTQLFLRSGKGAILEDIISRNAHDGVALLKKRIDKDKATKLLGGALLTFRLRSELKAAVSRRGSCRPQHAASEQESPFECN